MSEAEAEVENVDTMAAESETGEKKFDANDYSRFDNISDDEEPETVRWRFLKYLCMISSVLHFCI